MSRLLRIGIDIDGVMARFDQAFAEVLAQFSAVPIPVDAPDFPPVWDWPAHYGISQEAEQQAWNWVMEPANGFWWRLPPMEGVVEAVQQLNELRQQGHLIYFITSRPGPHCKRLTEKWLQYWGVTNPTVLISNRKGLVASGLQLDAFIDDRDRNAMEVALARGNACRVFLLERPYNSHCREGWQGLKFLQEVELVGTVGEMLDRLGVGGQVEEEMEDVAA